MVNSVHLLVLVHGMWGNPIHLAELQRIALETYAEPTAEGTSLEILTAETIRDESTYDGMDWGGERVAKEVLEKVKSLEEKGKTVTRFSITGYSLGGLISRYCIGVLDQQGFFDKIEPTNFNTVATPHCGLPRYRSFFSTVASKLGPRLLSRTGEQFYCADKWSPKGRPLLVVMADPCEILDRIIPSARLFYQALKKFRHIRIYANAINDITVPYVTAAIETEDPFAEEETNGIQVKRLEKYEALVESYSLPDVTPPKPEKPKFFSIAWFKRMKPRPILPFNPRFPLNLVLYALLPILIPTFITIALSRFALASRSSRSRIKQLEKEATMSGQQRLVHILAEIEREMEDAVVDLMDNNDTSAFDIQSKAHPIISANHMKIATWLNTLPIKKEIAYFPNLRNSHATIVSRDIKRFEFHRLGEPVIRHWANTLII
ncbi:lipid particle protein [Crepidotus variabilis]|uniref:Lipid particle protein n=1 Tax=Crepidotus variabilis TaxID=179855 RepID=A0A9P6JS27_9AGAR|nr:lipid particle protein [Crepidotus variabilis]